MRIRKRFLKSTAVNKFNTIIKPHFEYGSTILYKFVTGCDLSLYVVESEFNQLQIIVPQMFKL